WSRAVLTVAALCLSAGFVWGLTSALASSASPSPSNGKVILRLGWLAGPDNLNPFIGTTSSAFTVWYMNYDTLVGLNTTDIAPNKTTGLANGWSTSADGKTWTFTLRQNAKWQDGQPVTAADVAWTYNDIVKNDIANWTSYTTNIVKATAVGASTVQIDCSAPQPALLANLAEVPILPEHVWAKIPTKTAKNSFANAPPIVGSGPFQCVQWKKSDYLVMEANKSYWRGAPHVDEVVFEEYTNADTMGEDMKSGAIDGCLGLLQAQMKQLSHVAGVQVRAVYVNGYDELGFNCYTGGPSLGNPVLKDWRFRQALQWAVDKNKLSAIAYGGMAKPADTVITANYYRSPDWHWTPPADQAYSFDLAKASQLLTAAGYKEVNGARLDHSGKPISLRLYARSSYPQSVTCGEFLTGWFRRLGLKVTLSTLDDGALESDLYNTVKGVFTPNYDMFEWGWYNDVDPGPSLSYLTTGQIDNWSDCAWSDRQYDATYKAQATEMDQAKRQQLVYKCQQIIYQQSPYIPLAYSDDTEAWNTARWTGWVEMPARVGNVVFPPYGFETYFSVRPVTGGSKGQAGLIGVLVIGGVLVVVIVVALLWVLFRRRSRTSEVPLEE
ncbi:MAG: ABC transporter substrate-binding protein, partial [Thermoleophilia bacterium]